MNTKLTLKLNKKTIDRAKKYAFRKKQSLSVMVENYFNMVANSEYDEEIEISPNVMELAGIIQLPNATDAKENYHKHLEEKYL